MSRDKFDKSAGDKIAGAIREIEKQTNAEMVVVVRGRSGAYRQADYLFGAIVAGGEGVRAGDRRGARCSRRRGPGRLPGPAVG